MRILGLTVAAACGLLAGTALAQQHPPLQPTRDVTVTYHVTGEAQGARGGAAGEDMRIRYSAETHRMRVETHRQGHESFAIVDRAQHRMVVVLPAQHRYMELPMRPSGNPALMEDDPNLRFARGGQETVAGVSCTDWKVSDRTNPDHRGTACLTTDGVLLRGSDATGARGIVATKVEYGAIPAELFSPPSGFQKMDVPAMPRR